MSSAVDEDTVRAVDEGRETVGAMISSAQGDLQKVFIVFVIGFVGTFYALRVWVWDFFQRTAEANMSGTLAEATELITRTPFEVILLQAKIGLLFGILVAIPAFLYFSRDALKRRDISGPVPLSRWSLVGFVLASFTLFGIGIAYAYGVFFPFTFFFLGDIAYSAGVKPSWGITEFTQFVALLTLSFGLAAQLPLFMSAFSYTEIVPYETFRDKWRYAILGITLFGALFSPPDPFTQMMWAMPLVLLYVFSLGLAKLVANTRRRGAAEVGSGVAHVKRRALQTAAGVLVLFAATAGALAAGAPERIATAVVPKLPGAVRPTDPTIISSLITEHGTLGILAASALIVVGIVMVVLVVVTIRVLRSPVYPRESQLLTAETVDDIDFDVLDASDVERIPASVFTNMTEDEMMNVARDAMEAEDREKAQAIIDRFDSLAAMDADERDEGSAADAAAGAAGADDEDESVFASTAAGMLDPFTEDETTEDDIGGIAYDFTFIIESLTSKLIYIVGLFMAVLAGSFFWLYAGGVTRMLATFIRRVPDSVLYEVAQRNDTDVTWEAINGATSLNDYTEIIRDMGFVISLHPVEVLLFIVKISTLLAAVSVLPLVLYFAWPAAKERGLVRGDRRLFIVWGGSMLGGFALGTFVGFYFIAPGVISYLITDAVTNQMEIAYRIKSFFWLVIYTTLGVGFLFNIVVTMALFHTGDIVSYRRMRRHWRPVVVGIFTVSAFVSPSGLLTMFAFAIPLSVTYMLGLAVLYVLTAGGRLFGGGGGEDVPDPDGTDAVTAGE